MKLLMKSLTAVGFAGALALGTAACSGIDSLPFGNDAPSAAQEKAPAESGKPAPADAGKKVLSGDAKKDALTQGINVAMDADSRWEGDTLHVKLKKEQGENGIRAFTNCMVTDQLLEKHQTAVMEFTDATVACIDVLPQD